MQGTRHNESLRCESGHVNRVRCRISTFDVLGAGNVAIKAYGMSCGGELDFLADFGGAEVDGEGHSEG